MNLKTQILNAVSENLARAVLSAQGVYSKCLCCLTAVHGSSACTVGRLQSLPGRVSGSVRRNQGATHLPGEDQEC